MSPISTHNSSSFTVGIALNGAGWHPAAWREPNVRPADLFRADYWRSLAETAASAGVDYLTVDDSLALQGSAALDAQVPAGIDPSTVQGRLDALLVLSWIAPHVSGLGLIPAVTVTHTEPFHVATALQTLDFVSEGCAGWQVRISTGAAEAAAFGRRPAPEIDADRVRAGETDPALDELLDEAADAVEVARRLWDSWEDDAVIRDIATGRFLDRDRVHRIEFEGSRFSVAGPSIVPRSPQGQLPVALLSHSSPVHRLAARSADAVFITPASQHAAAGASRGKSVADLVAEVRAAEASIDREALGLAPLRIVADLVVALDSTLGAAPGTVAGETAAERLHRLDGAGSGTWAGDAALIAGGAAEVADAIAAWRAAGIDGVRLRPLAHAVDVPAIAETLLPELRRRGLARPAHETPGALREALGLEPAPNRYAAATEHDATRRVAPQVQEAAA